MLIWSVSFLVLFVTVRSTSPKFYIDNGALVIFNGTLTESAVSDVLESTLYSQILASHAYDRFSEFTQWYAANFKTLEQVAWMLYSSDFMVQLDNKSSSLQEAVVKKISDAFDKENAAILCSGFTGLSNNSSMDKLFSHAVSQGNMSNFQILLTSADAAGDIVISYTGFVVYVIGSQLRILFTSSGLGTLRLEDYEVHRYEVSNFVKQYSESLIKEIKFD